MNANRFSKKVTFWLVHLIEMRLCLVTLILAAQRSGWTILIGLLFIFTALQIVICQKNICPSYVRRY